MKKTSVKILLVQAILKPRGGGNAVAVWMIEALKHDYELHVYTIHPVDWDALNQFYGTSLSPSDFHLHVLPAFIRSILSLDPDPGSVQGLALLMRLAKWTKNRYKAILIADNEADFGKRSIQYIHYPDWVRLYQKLYNKETHKRKPLSLKYLHLWKIISGMSFKQVKNNLSLVNSNWTGKELHNFYGISGKTLYPPVPGGFINTPWNKRKNGFICIGRITHIKRLEHIIRIMRVLRARGHDLHLHMIGIRYGPSSHWQYYWKILKQIQHHSSWITLHENISRNELVKIVSSNKYGIHRQPDECFGIAVAEMVKGGCITFTHHTGGQAEIVGDEERLKYSSDAEAVRKIENVLKNSKEQAELKKYLDTRKNLFSTQRFMKETREIVGQFIAGEI